MVPTAFLAATLAVVGDDARAQGSYYGQDGTGSSYAAQGATGASPMAGQGAAGYGGSGFNVEAGAAPSAWNGGGAGGWNGGGAGGWNGGGAEGGTSSHGQPRAFWEPQARSSYWELSTYNQGPYSGAGGRSAAGVGAGFNAGPPPPGATSSVLGVAASRPSSIIGPAALQSASPYIQPNPMYPQAVNSPYGQAGVGAYQTGSLYPQAGSPYSLYPQAGSTNPQAGSPYSLYPQADSPYSLYSQANSPYLQTNSQLSQIGQPGVSESGAAFPRLGAGGPLGIGTPPPEIEPPPFTAAAAARNAGAALLQLNAEADLRNTQAARLNGLYP